MGWFSSACSAVSSFCSGVASSVSSGISSAGRAVSSAFSSVSRAVTNTVSSIMERGEAFIGGVKTALKFVSEFVSKVANTVKDIALGWIQKGVEILVGAFNTLGKKIAETFDTFIQWLINLFKKKKEEKKETSTPPPVYTAEDEEEEQKSASYKVLIEENRSKVSGQQLKMLERIDMLNRYVGIRAKIKRVLAHNLIADFDHYLRLRAVQKLLEHSEQLLGKAIDMDTITDDDVFIIKVASELMEENPTLSEDQLDRLNGIVYQRFNKELIPFVFEEMIKAWSKELSELDKQWQDNNKTTSKKSVMLKRLENNLKFDIELDDDEMAELEELRIVVPQEIQNQKDLFDLINSKQYFIFAGEGLLQVLEANEKLQGREYLTSQISIVGKIIIDCAQHGKKWEVLNSEEQNLVINFANIFRADAMERGELLTVENAG